MAEVPAAHWIALACPTVGLNLDKRFLAFLDDDDNGRVRVEELLRHIAWVDRMLRNKTGCERGSDVLALEDLSSDGADLRKSALLLLQNLDADDRSCISLAQVQRKEEALKASGSNGDGVVAPGAIADESLRRLADDVVAYAPGRLDASGEAGVDRAGLAEFSRAREAALDWFGREAAVKPAGEDALPAAEKVRAARDRLDTWFLQCRLVSAQPGAVEYFKLTHAELEVAAADEGALRKGLERLPVATPNAAGVLTFDQAHPVPANAPILELPGAIARILDREVPSLTEADWLEALALGEKILAWEAERAQHPVATLGRSRLEEITTEQLAALDQLCADDLALGHELGRIGELETLLLCQKHLVGLVNNFVAMPYLYAGTRHPIFHQGKLIMAGREFHLSVYVENVGAHKALAAESSMFLLYVKVDGRKVNGTVAVPVTCGTSDGLYVGKRGIFVDLDDVEHDALVIDVMRNPISVREAALAPFARIGSMIQARLEGIQGKADEAFNQRATTAIDAAHRSTSGAIDVSRAAAVDGRVPAATTDAPAAAPASMVNVVMAGGLAVAALGSAFAFVAAKLTEVGPVGAITIVVAMLAAIILPFALLAWWKLRKRNLAGILEASGWALNDRLLLTRRLGARFTRRPPRPPGSRLEWTDLSVPDVAATEDEESPAERWRKRLLTLLLALLLASVAAAWLWTKLGNELPWMDRFQAPSESNKQSE